MPTPPEDVARGAGADRGAAAPRARTAGEHRARRAARSSCDGDTVVTEHVEHWEWPTGETAALPFVSMQELRDGKIVRWWDYWDLGTLMNAAPAWWVEHIMTRPRPAARA